MAIFSISIHNPTSASFPISLAMMIDPPYNGDITKAKGERTVWKYRRPKVLAAQEDQAEEKT
jgi:hypothetical protein